MEIREAFIGDVDQGFEEAQGLLAAGDVPGLLRCLRADGDSLSLGALTVPVAEVGRLTGCADLALAATAVAESGDGSGAEDAKALYDFGCECVDHKLGFLAVRPLARALELAPDDLQVLIELATALGQEGRHTQVVSLLEEHAPAMGWVLRLQYVYNALMAGRPGAAECDW